MDLERRLVPERRTYKLDKLVRDGIYANMLEMGQIVSSEHPSGVQPSRKQLSEDKLTEELEEFMRADTYDSSVKEAADFMAAWDSYLRYCLRVDSAPARQLGNLLDKLTVGMLKREIPIYFVRQRQAELKDELGEYDHYRYVYSISLLPDDEYNEYYSGQPERFPRLE